MATQEQRLADFKERLDEIGILECISFEPFKETPNRYQLTAEKHKFLNFNIVHHALMGLIAHFQNRNWVEDWSYMFIMKGMHNITFTDKPTN